MQIIKIIFNLFWLFYPYEVISNPILLCLTGKIELSLPEYRVSMVNAANLALNQKRFNYINLKTYFYDNKPFSPLVAYKKMLQDKCSAIIGYEYLADLLLIAKKQENDKIPIFTSYASTNKNDNLPNNFFIFEPNYEYQSQKMLDFLYKKFGKIHKVLIITEIDRSDLLKYKKAYNYVLTHADILYDTFDFISNDNTFEKNLQNAITKKQYHYIILLTNSVNSTTIINYINDHKIIFIGTENFGSSVNQSVFVRLKDKNVIAYTIRNLDFFKKNKSLELFLNEYKQKYLSMPNMISLYTYDAINIILKTLEKYGSITPNKILNINFNGVTGIKIKNQHFYRSNQYTILSIKNNGFNYV